MDSALDRIGNILLGIAIIHIPIRAGLLACKRDYRLSIEKPDMNYEWRHLSRNS